jgi:Alternative complex III, ActD subunit
MIDPKVFGLMAEFDNVNDAVIAARRTYAAGYRKLDAYSPFPVEELSEAIGFHKNGVALICLIGGLLGGTAAFTLQWWINTISYPVNIGGRPLNSWPSFIIVTFEMTILFSGLSAVFGMLALNGLPMPYHPVFNVPRFELASKDRFFIVVFSSDKNYDAIRTRQFLEGLNPISVAEVPS